MVTAVLTLMGTVAPGKRDDHVHKSGSNDDKRGVNTIICAKVQSILYKMIDKSVDCGILINVR